MTEQITFTLDDKQVTVPKGTTVYQACVQEGIDIPIFCYQDRMPPFGACRVCMVEVEKMAKPQTSCTLVAQEGMIVRTQAKMAVQAREEILEFLLINHPLDCPICDRGGECPLQDQALDHGPGKSRFFEDKRHFEKALHLGPVLTLDRERCITCARCTRFGDIVAGDHALEFIERGYRSEVGTADGEAPKSKFIGNTIAICPVGALTSEVYRFRARPWDNLATESTCTLCPVGCSMYLDSRDGEVMRTRSCENRAVNDIWLCDKGWFGYEFSSSEHRLTSPLVRKNGKLEPVSWDEAFAFVAGKMKAASGMKSAALGGNTLTVEENYLLQLLMRDVINSPHVDHRVGMDVPSLHDEGLEACMQIEIGDVENLSHVLLAGLDITEEFPVIWLRLKQAINKGAKVTFIGHFAPEVSRYFEKTFIHTPGLELEELKKIKASIPSQTAIFVGSQYLNNPARAEILKELDTWQKSSLNVMEGSNNSCGARYAGMHPELRPLGKKAEKAGLNARQILEQAAGSGWDLLYVVGSDVASKVSSELWQKVREKTGCIIVQDIFMTKTGEAADVVLPSLGFVEKGGSFLNIEHRIQKLKPGKSIPKGAFADSYIFVRLAQRLGFSLVMTEQFIDSLKAGRLPLKREAIVASPQPKRPQNGSVVATFSHKLFDHGVRMKHNEHLVQLANEPRVRVHSSLGYKTGARVVISTSGKSLEVVVAVDDTVAKNTVVIPLGFDTLQVAELGMGIHNGMPVDIR